MSFFKYLLGKKKDKTLEIHHDSSIQKRSQDLPSTSQEETNAMDWKNGYGYFITPNVGGGAKEEKLSLEIYNLIVSWGNSCKLPSPCVVTARQYAKGDACTVLFVAQSQTQTQQAMQAGLQDAINKIHHVELELANPSKIQDWIQHMRYEIMSPKSFVVQAIPGKLSDSVKGALDKAKGLIKQGKLFDAKTILMDTISNGDASLCYETYNLAAEAFEKNKNFQSAIMLYDKVGDSSGIERIAIQMGLVNQLCKNHEKRQAVGQCMGCDAHFCRDCATEYAGMFVCHSCKKR